MAAGMLWLLLLIRAPTIIYFKLCEKMKVKRGKSIEGTKDCALSHLASNLHASHPYNLLLLPLLIAQVTRGRGRDLFRRIHRFFLWSSLFIT
jgi:hypothetical protein